MGAMPYILYPFIRIARKINIYFIFYHFGGKIGGMKNVSTVFLLSGICALPLCAESLLTAQSFPKTFEDLPFDKRIEVLREGYMPFEVQYDNNGVCISGCAYRGITIKEDMDAIDEANEEMAALIAEEENANQGTDSESTTIIVAKDWCRNGLSTKLPLRYPVNMTNFNKRRITSDFGFRNIKDGSKLHPAVDIGVPVGTSVYATADGVVSKVWWDENGGGNVIDIKHDKGLVTQYLHLDKPLVSVGDKVSACQKIALSGNTGKSHGAHLDYRVRFSAKSNKYVDILCPTRSLNKGTEQSFDTDIIHVGNKHSLFNAKYKFKNQSAKSSQWRVKHGHCMRNVNDLLPDEVK